MMRSSVPKLSLSDSKEANEDFMCPDFHLFSTESNKQPPKPNLFTYCQIRILPDLVDRQSAVKNDEHKYEPEFIETNTSSSPSIATSTIQVKNDKNKNNFTLKPPTNMRPNSNATETVDFEKIKNNGSPYKCPLCVTFSQSFETWPEWIEHWNSFHFLECFHFHLNNAKKEENIKIKTEFADNILFHDTYFGLIMEFFTPKQYVESLSLVTRFHHFFPQRDENQQIMFRMINYHFFDVQSCSIVPIQDIYQCIKTLHHFPFNVNLSQIVPFTKHIDPTKTDYCFNSFKLYPDTTIKTILWQYDLLKIYSSLQIVVNSSEIPWTLSTKIFDIVCRYDADHIVIKLCPKRSTFAQQLELIQWFVPEIKKNIVRPAEKIQFVKQMVNCMKQLRISTCSSLTALKKIANDITQCIHRINNINPKFKSEQKTQELNEFHLISAKICGIDKIIQTKISEYENKYVVLNQHIVTSKKKAQTALLLGEIVEHEMKISRMDLDVFEMDQGWLEEKKSIISELEKAVKQQRDELLKRFEEWTLENIVEYVEYLYDDKIRFSAETMKRFELLKLDGSKIIDINDSLLILADINNEETRKLLMKAMDGLLDDYAAHKYSKTQICCICTTNEVNTVCFPCGHCCYCSECRKKCMRHYSTSKCPICRTKIIKIVTIYRSGMYK